MQYKFHKNVVLLESILICFFCFGTRLSEPLLVLETTARCAPHATNRGACTSNTRFAGGVRENKHKHKQTPALTPDAYADP